MCIIVDDSNDVWRHHAHNLLHVERYIYFPSSRRQLKVRRATFLEAQKWASLAPLVKLPSLRLNLALTHWVTKQCMTT